MNEKKPAIITRLPTALLYPQSSLAFSKLSTLIYFYIISQFPRSVTFLLLHRPHTPFSVSLRSRYYMTTKKESQCSSLIKKKEKFKADLCLFYFSSSFHITTWREQSYVCVSALRNRRGQVVSLWR